MLTLPFMLLCTTGKLTPQWKTKGAYYDTAVGVSLFTAVYLPRYFLSPSLITQELFKEFVAEMTRVHGVGKYSKSYFCRIWRVHRSHLKLKTGGDFMKCNHDTLHGTGSSGIRATVDSAVREAVDIERDENTKVTVA